MSNVLNMEGKPVEAIEYRESDRIGDGLIAMLGAVESLKELAEKAPHQLRHVKIEWNGVIYGAAAFTRVLMAKLDYVQTAARVRK